MKGSDTIVRLDGDLLTTKVDGDLMGISVEQGVCYGFDSITTRVWELLETPRSFASLCAQLVEEFEVDEDQCRADLTELLQGLRGDDLVSIRPGK